MGKKLNIRYVLKRFEEIHAYNYNYDSFTDYINVRQKIDIKCNLCNNIFNQRIKNHLDGQGCPKCAGNEKLTLDAFKKIANNKHNNFYNYNLSFFEKITDKIIITCPNHGDYKQTVKSHLEGHGCRECYDDRRRNDIKINEDYIYNDDYVNRFSNITITCKKHGDFNLRADEHLNGRICPKCTREKFIKNKFKKFNKIHNSKYDYSKSEYIDNKTKIIITCAQHGDFEQRPDNHIHQGCPKCNASKGENKIMKYLNDNNIYYIQEYKFDNCKYISHLKFDFYIPKYNLCIEYDGKQHFEPVNIFGGKKNLEYVQKLDGIKNDFCCENNINLLRIPYINNKVIEKLFDNFFI